MKKIRTKLMTTPQVRKYLDKLHRLERRVLNTARIWEKCFMHPYFFPDSCLDCRLAEAVQALNKFNAKEK